jgi:O-antigen ligase
MIWDSSKRSRDWPVALIGFLLAIPAMANLVPTATIGAAPRLNLTLLALLLLVATAAFRPAQSPPGTLGGLLLLLVAFSPGFVGAGLNPEAGARRIEIAVLVLGLMLVVYLVARSPFLVGGFVAGVLSLGVIALAAQWLNPDLVVLTQGRRTPVGANAIGTGRALGFAALVAITRAIACRGHLARQLGWVVVAGAFAAGASAAASRGPLLALAVSVVAVLLSSVQLSSVMRSVLVLLALGIGGLAVRDLVDSGSRLVSAGDTGRAELFSATWQVVQRHPTGIGWGNLYNYLPGRVIIVEQGYHQYPHNLVLEVLAACGIVGGVLMMLGLVVAGRAAYKARRLMGDSLLWGAFLYALFGAMFSSSVVGNRMLWVVCAMSLGIWTRAASSSFAEIRGGNNGVPAESPRHGVR